MPAVVPHYRLRGLLRRLLSCLSLLTWLHPTRCHAFRRHIFIDRVLRHHLRRSCRTCRQGLHQHRFGRDRTCPCTRLRPRLARREQTMVTPHRRRFHRVPARMALHLAPTRRRRMTSRVASHTRPLAHRNRTGALTSRSAACARPARRQTSRRMRFRLFRRTVRRRLHRTCMRHRGKCPQGRHQQNFCGFSTLEHRVQDAEVRQSISNPNRRLQPV